MNMPSQTQKSSNSRKASKSSRSDSNVDATRSNKSRAKPMDAIALLTADHKQVAEWFEQLEKASSDETSDEMSDESKQTLAQQICAALTVHATIEEEIFYPAFLEATGEIDIHHEAEVEHQGAKNLIAEIEDSSPDDEYFDAKVKVLAELIRHHVNEEEQSEGMFAKARESGMDLDSLGEQLQERKEELADVMPPQRRVG